jgi:hypothetical protein
MRLLFFLNCNLLQTSNSLQDSLQCINTRVCAPIFMLSCFFDSPVNSFAEIHAVSTADDLDGGFSIGQMPQHRLTMRSPSTVADR